ncbi:MAG: uracil-DNA glycosylase [Ilumatobacteraceae bacterium]
MGGIEILQQEIERCEKCPRLTAWRASVAIEKRAAYRDETYWGKPISGFGDPHAQIVVVGLAPGAHGANRTGRVFTGDRSGDWLYRAMFRAGLANQPESSSRGDGLELFNAWVTVAVKCAPPDNKPTPGEKKDCSTFLERELKLLTNATLIVCLGGFAYRSICEQLDIKHPPKFGHGVRVSAERFSILCSYHPSQQNTFTGKLTESMLDRIFMDAKELVGSRN